MAQYVVRDIPCKTIINRVHGMPFRWSINPYRGCRHACVYCYARPTHEFLGLNAGNEFQEVVFAKTNAPEVLRRQLSSPSWKGDDVVIGTATDPYQQAESRYQLTRRILQVFKDFRNPVSLTTKSPLVLRDIDILASLAREASATVHVTVTTLDESLWRTIEPTTSRPRKRLEAIRALREAGVRAGVFLSPILPGLTDDVDHLEHVIAAATDVGADFIYGDVLRLGRGISESLLPVIHAQFPALVPLYNTLYPGDYARTSYRQEIKTRVAELKQRYDLVEGTLPAKSGSRDVPVAVQPVLL